MEWSSSYLIKLGFLAPNNYFYMIVVIALNHSSKQAWIFSFVSADLANYGQLFALPNQNENSNPVWLDDGNEIGTWTT